MIRPWLALAWLLLSAAVAAGWAARTPHHNWDMIPYVGCAIGLDGGDAAAVHAATFDRLDAHVDAATRAALTDGPHRSAVALDPATFALQLPLYRIRVLYVAAIYAAWKLGADPFTASHALSALAALGGMGVFAWIAGRRGVWVPLLLLPLGVVGVARLSTPDGLAFLTVAGLYALFRAGRLRELLLAAPLVVLVRSDLALLVPCLGVAVALEQPRLRIGAAVASILALGGAALVHGALGYGWSTTLFVTLVRTVPNPAELDFAVTPAFYARSVVTELGWAVRTPSFLLFVAASLGLLAWHAKRGVDGLGALHYAGLAYVAVHFAVFPVVWERLFLAQYALTAIAALDAVHALTASRSSPRPRLCTSAR